MVDPGLRGTVHLKGLPGTGSIRKSEVLPRVTLFIAIKIFFRSVAHTFKNVQEKVSFSCVLTDTLTTIRGYSLPRNRARALTGHISMLQ